MSDYMNDNVAKLKQEFSVFDWTEGEPAFEISDDGDLVMHRDDDHTSWVIEKMADPDAEVALLDKRTLKLMVEMLED